MLVLLTFLAGCGVVPEDAPGAPADREGTWETASALTLGACGVVQDGQGSAEVVLNLDGVCVAYGAVAQIDTCSTYATMEVAINGVPLKRTLSGGWSSVATFAPRFPGDHGHGCIFPKFELPCERPDTCFTPALFIETGTVDVSIKIGDESRTFTAEHWLGDRKIRLASDPLVRGSAAFVETGPRGEGRVTRETGTEAIWFVYDDSKLNTAWCAILHNAQPYATQKYGELRPEAAALRIEALEASSDSVAARALGSAFLAAHPRHPAAVRVRRALGETTP